MSRQNTIRAAGYVWHGSCGEYSIPGGIGKNNRWHPLVWQFGSIWQNFAGCDDNPDIHLELEHQKTIRAAMRHVVDWINEYEKNGPEPLEVYCNNLFQRWPTLFRTRRDLINSIMFNGGRSDWLDGRIVNTAPESHIESARRDIWEREQWEKRNLEREKEGLGPLPSLDREEPQPGPIPDIPGSYPFGRLREPWQKKYDDRFRGPNILCVPDNVTQPWLELAWEAVNLMIDYGHPPFDDYFKSFNDGLFWPLSDSYLERYNQTAQINFPIALKIREELKFRFGDMVPDFSPLTWKPAINVENAPTF